MGRRRVGLAISDTTCTLARPLTTLTIERTPKGTSAVDQVVSAVERLAAEEDGLQAVVVGVPVCLDGSPSDETVAVARFVTKLRERITIPVLEADERLTSREAESRLAERERDWRKRKAQLDAAAAAIILQDFLDSRAG